MKTAKEVLLGAAELLTDERWIQGNSSQDAAGIEIYPDVPAACRWCTDGGLQKIAGDDIDVCEDARLAILNVLGDKTLEDWNDEPGRTAADVRALLRKAAEWYSSEERHSKE